MQAIEAEMMTILFFSQAQAALFSDDVTVLCDESATCAVFCDSVALMEHLLFELL